jgi:type I restriction enzyme S subunit
VKDLPKGWVKAKIKDVSIKCVQNKPNDEEKLVYVDIGSINRKLKVIENPQHLKGVDAPSRARKRINTNDVLVSLTRPNLNAIAHVPKDFDEQYASTGFEVIKSVGVDSRYLFALVKTHNFINAITGVVQGALYPAAKSSDVQNYEFPLAPLNEQTRIADKLDSMLAKVDAAQARLDKIPNILKRFRQSVLAAATSGELTNSKENYQLVELNQIALNIVDCPHSTPKWTDSGKYCVRTTAFNPFFLDLSKQGFVSDETYEDRIKRLKPKPGDILYSREGTIGVACQIPKGIELCLGQRMVIIRAGELILPEYLTIVLNSDVILSKIKKLTVGTTVPRINMKDIRAFMIPLPSVEEQTEIVRRIESLFSMADAVEKQYIDAKARINRLTQSILAKAFRGELVEQDKNDESAEGLLIRILSEKENKLSVKPTRKSVTKKNNISRVKIGVDTNVDEASVIKWIKNLKKDAFRNEDLNESFGSDYEQLKEILFSLLKEDKPMITKVFDVAKKDFMFKKV